MSNTAEAHPDRHPILVTLTGGLVTAIITVAYAASFAALVYGEVPGAFVRGVGLTLFGVAVMRIVVDVTSSAPGIISHCQDIPSAILALVAAGIAHSLSASASSEVIFQTVAAAVVISTLLSGLFFLLLGYFKLGELVRFLPYPVVGGYLAGTGWLLFAGGIGIMTGEPVTFGRLPILFQPEILLSWLPGLVLGTALLLALQHFRRYWILPLLLAVAGGLFYLYLALTGTPVDQVSAQGWLMGPLPSGSLWRPLYPAELLQADWDALLGQSGNIATILIVSVVALLLNATGLELVTGRDLNLNRELLAAGLGNLAAGLAGGIAGYHSLSLSTLSHKMGADNRLTALVSAAFLFATLFFGASLLALIPRFILGGLVTYLGILLLQEWLLHSWSRFARIDYLIIVAILVIIAGVGFLEGVLFGVLLSVVMFVVNYSRVNVVRYAFSGADFQSRVTRGRRQQEILSRLGDEIYILQLHGFIFFGTANNLLKQLLNRLETAALPCLRYVILDFTRVTGLDATATFSFDRMIRLAQDRDFILAFAGQVPEGVLPGHGGSIVRFFAHLSGTALTMEEPCIHLFPDLDRALEWCENQLLLRSGVRPADDLQSLRTLFSDLLRDDVSPGEPPPADFDLERLLAYFDRLELKDGQHLIRQGDPPEALYFIETGQVSAQLEYPDRPPVRLETMRGGRVVGEIGFFLGTPRTASVIADESSTVYRLTTQALRQMEQSDPRAAFAFHQAIIRLLSERTTHLIRTVNALQQ